MNLQQLIPLSDVYASEEEFSDDLADNIDALNVGTFEDVKRKANVGTREADIVAIGEDGILVVENQLGKADWDHWGRLEAYARLNEATVAVLVAEGFEDLMIETCRLRNEESKINWYLIQAQANSHKEFFFQHVVEPTLDIRVERETSTEYSEFWAPIRKEEGPFAGKQIPINRDGIIKKAVKGVRLILQLRKDRCYVHLYFRGENRLERRDDIVKLFPKPQYDYRLREAPKYVAVTFPVLDKGKENRDDWDEIRDKLVAKGTEVYNKIYESDL